MDSEDFRRFFRYDHWANNEVLLILEAMQAAPARSLSLFGHVLAVEYLWCSRLKGDRPPLVVWPQMTVTECRQHVPALKAMWEDYLSHFGSAVLAANVTYKNSKGEEFTNGVADLLTHVVIHSAHHRGQIASDIRAAGHAPASTDFLRAVRQQVPG